MSDMEKESISMRLDRICKKLYEKAEPIGVCDLDAWCDCEISDKIDLLENMVSSWWKLKTKISKLESDLNRISKNAVNKIESLEKERDRHFQSWVEAEAKIKELESLLHGYQEKPHAKQEVHVYSEPKTRQGNKNAARKDIDPVNVYRLVKGGMSISKVAEKYNASRQTIRKYYNAGENMCTHDDYNEGEI